jgi:cell fate (sporulation/competence/biofilm development) regulator YlbF (YheA/YmcA/DUF963 family)
VGGVECPGLGGETKSTNMQAAIEDTIVIRKTRDLCQTIVEQPEFRSIRERVEAFLSNDAAKSQYQRLMEKGDALQHKQQMGMPLSGDEIAEFEKSREQLLANDLARDFLDAQQEMHKLQESVMQYVGKTFELGRVPSADDFPSGDCGPSCGCGH